jgi:multiple sugar transport system substrate-binding protein
MGMQDRNTRRRAMALGATFSATLAAACEGVTTQSGAGTGTSGAAGGKIVWLVRGQQVENDWEQNVVLPKMKALHPGIEIDMQITSDTWNEKVFALEAAGTPAEVHNGIVGTFILLYAQNKLLELTPLTKRDKFDVKAFGGYQNDPDMCRSGKQWSLPILTTLGNMTFYNINHFQEAGIKLPPTSWSDKGWNWNYVTDIARRMTRNWGQEGAVYGYLPFGQFHPWAYLWKGDTWAPDFYAHGVSRDSRWTSPEAVESTQFYQDLALRHQVSPRRGAPSAGFAAGGAAMWGTTGWNTSGLLKIDLFKWGIAPIPWQRDNRTLCFTDCVLINKATRAPEAAWALVKYLTSQEGQLDYAKATGRPPTRTDAFDPWLELTFPATGFQNKDQLREVITGYLKNRIDNWAHYVIDARQYQVIQTEAENQLLSGSMSPSALLTDVKTKMESQLRQTHERFKDSVLVRDSLCT